MSAYTVYTLEASNITVSGGKELSGYWEGDGSQLEGETITLNNNNWVAVEINDTSNDRFEDWDTDQTLVSETTYNGETHDAGLVVTPEYTVEVQDPDGNIYTLQGFNINEAVQPPGVDAYGTVEGLAFVGEPGGFPPIGVPLTVISTEDYPDTPYDSLVTPQCFTAGCEISTPNGLQKIETLRVGDTVLTKDHGPQTIRWIGQRKFSAGQLAQNTKLRPIRIVKEALGNGLPKRDLLVSRQHRMLMRSKIARRMFDVSEVLVPAIKLINLPGIFIDEQVETVEYFHLLFDQHEIIFAEGAPSESLLTGPQALKGLTPEARAEILSIFPELAEWNPALRSARLIPSGKQQKKLVYRHLKNSRPCLEVFSC
ncbi:MAG: calcium-binding protein [Rhodobacterales bacterium]|nr:MAG: calcium-binding protein [Rhodobacterales bacterium]